LLLLLHRPAALSIQADNVVDLSRLKTCTA
jgi:hypothetical protein